MQHKREQRLFSCFETLSVLRLDEVRTLVALSYYFASIEGEVEGGLK